jgi:hypothetical protein
LALGGILLGLLIALMEWVISMSSVNILLSTRKVLLAAAMALYFVGFALLLWATHISKSTSSDNSNLLELAALFFPLLFTPLVIFLAVPNLTGNYTISWLLTVADRMGHWGCGCGKRLI